MPEILSPQFAVVVLATLLASVVSGSLAFGFGIVLVSILQFFVVPVDIVILSVAGSVVSCVVRVAETRHVRTNGRSRVMTLAGMAGVPAGLYLLHLHVSDPVLLRRLFSVAIFAAATLVLVRSSSRPVVVASGPASRAVQTILGALGGFMCGATSLGGPPVVLCSLIQGWDKMQAHAILARYFLAITGFSCVGILSLRLLHRNTAVVVVLLVPVVLGGVHVGTCLRDRISERQFKLGMTIFLLLSAVGGFTNTFWNGG